MDSNKSIFCLTVSDVLRPVYELCGCLSHWVFITTLPGQYYQPYFIHTEIELREILKTSPRLRSQREVESVSTPMSFLPYPEASVLPPVPCTPSLLSHFIAGIWVWELMVSA